MKRMNRRKRERIMGTAGKVTFDLFVAVYAVTVCMLAVQSAMHHKNTEQAPETIEAAAAVTTTTTAAADARGCSKSIRASTKEASAEPITEGMDVPTGDTAFKSYMSYKAITNKESRQYKLQRMCWTDADGLRRYKTYYVVALGSYYADYIGERFRITTEDGNEIECVVGDFKADRHTDRLNQYTPMEGRKCVVEFVVDTRMLDKTAKKMGDISYIEGFSGDIESIEKEKE